MSRVHIGREVMDVPEDFDRVELESGVGVAVLVDVVDAEDGDAVVRTAVHAVRVGHSLKVLLSIGNYESTSEVSYTSIDSSRRSY